ncbi:Alcohol dehydrogenase [Trifolium repens]|nr:Alcohol dehydrogenase [Trifolium repens]
MSNTAGQVIKCRAAVAWEAGKPLVIEEKRWHHRRPVKFVLRYSSPPFATLMFTSGKLRVRIHYFLVYLVMKLEGLWRA